MPAWLPLWEQLNDTRRTPILGAVVFYYVDVGQDANVLSCDQAQILGRLLAYSMSYRRSVGPGLPRRR